MSNYMDTNNIMEMIKNKEITPEEGYKLIEDIFNKKNSKKSELNYYTQEWTNTEDIKELFKLQGNILLFDTDERLFNKLKSHDNELNITLVKTGDSYIDINNEVFIINPKKKDDYKSLLKDIQKLNVMPSTIIHAWCKEDFKYDIVSIKSMLNKGIYSLFYLTQSLMDIKFKEKVNLFCLYENISNTIQPQFRGISGFLKTLSIENPNYNCKLIKLSSIDWKLLYEEELPTKKSLPTYPFEKKRHWVPEGNNTSIKTQTTEKEKSEILYYKCNWKEKEIIDKSPVIKENILLFENNGRKNKILIDGKIIHVKSGKKFNVIDDTTFEINPSEIEDYIKLLDNIKNRIKISKVLYLWSLENEVLEEYKLTEDYINDTISPIYLLCKALASTKMKEINRMICPFIKNEGIANPYIKAIKGFARSIVKVWPWFELTTINIEKDEESKIYDILVNEVNLEKENITPEVKYRNNKRYIRSIEECNMEAKEKISFRKNGVYIITGGMGAIGYITAEYIAKNYNGKLVLIGRSEMSKEKEERIKRLESLGGEAIYISADVTKVDHMYDAVFTASKKFGVINGVIHGAGIANKKGLLHKEIEEFRNTLMPKIQGTIAIDIATKLEQLDFFIMYSSASSILGDFGQGDYAVGNSFLDSYIEYRDDLRSINKRNGRTISINWPTWREGGIHLNKEGETLYLKSSGMTYLETKDGMEALEKIIKSGHKQVLVMSGYKKSHY